MVDSSIELRKQEAQRIKEQYGVIAPSFIYKYAPIEPSQAAKMAIDLDLVELNPERHGRERYQYSAEMRGLYLCRMFGVDVQGAYQLPEDKLKLRTPVQLFEHYSSNIIMNDVVQSEKDSRDASTAELLQLEIDLLRKRGMKVPEFNDLSEYCAWVPKRNGYIREIRKRYKDPKDNPYIPSSHEVEWDMREHYTKFIQNAKFAFDPLKDWELYLQGKKDLTDWEDGWNLQNLGKEGYDYYSMNKRWGYGTRVRPNAGLNYEDDLLTHTTNIHAATEILNAGFLQRYRVNFSSGRVSGSYWSENVTFIFPKHLLEQVYLLYPYIEPGFNNQYEREVRAYESISMAFCLGVVPTSPELFPDFYERSTGRLAIGDKAIRHWGVNYVKRGKLWSDKEALEIRAHAGSIEPKSRRVFDNFFQF